MDTVLENSCDASTTVPGAGADAPSEFLSTRILSAVVAEATFAPENEALAIIGGCPFNWRILDVSLPIEVRI
ncbi:protein of unknown function [Methylorubrum extorquens]|uniref:Uncharacterized protein n=1 Tax=Methylorubrum extorquens TaxID=408 RepID=A0A2N9AVT1_METEX|nr:protein of unknown function [Methylorubrum extorquens]